MASRTTESSRWTTTETEQVRTLERGEKVPGLMKTPPGRGRAMFIGGLLLVTGAIALVATFTATLATALFFGALLVMASIVQRVHATGSRSGGGFALELAVSLLYGAAGVCILIDPVAGAVGLTLLLAAFFIASGIARLLQAFTRRRRGNIAWLAVGGLVNLALGTLIAVGWPEPRSG